MSKLKQIVNIAARECAIMLHQPIYGFCMVVFPVLAMIFFTSIMREGVPEKMPVGVVDDDDTPSTRAMVRRLNAFQGTHVEGRYATVDEARRAVQRNHIYAFLYIPKGTTAGLAMDTRPKLSFYYSGVTMVAGSLLFKDLKTVTMLGSAEAGARKLAAIGKSDGEIRTLLQPIALDLHPIENPWLNYNIYLSTAMVPGVLMLFIFLIPPYSIGTELKFKRSKEWLAMADGNIWVAMAGKLLPQFAVFLTIFYAFEFYIFYVLGFPHPGGVVPILLLGFLAVAACEGAGVFAFGLWPSLRMSMSMCSLWSVLSFSMCGATFPVFAMDPMIESLAQLFPLRHYYMVYQTAIFNGFPLGEVWRDIAALAIFALLPVLTLWHVRKAMLKYVYIP